MTKITVAVRGDDGQQYDVDRDEKQIPVEDKI
jgi:hypothetical protein